MPSPIVRALARAASRIFYRADRAGEVPASGAVLILPNHANALLDPAIIWATAGRDVRFLAKSTLFGTPLRPLLAGAGAIPVYRRLDQGADTSKNTETFAAVEQALADGDAVCVFPEGISHSAGRLVPLRTGAARMALAAERRGVRVQLVAAGLNFDRKTTFRSRVTVVYGRPFSCADLIATGEPDAAIVRALTGRMAEQMRSLLIEADPGGDVYLVDRVDRLYASARGRSADPEDRVARRRAIASGIERLRRDDRPKFDALYLRFRRYDERLRRFGLRDRHLDWHISSAEALRFAVREILVAIVLVPLAAAAIAAFAVPYVATHLASRRFSRDADVEATAKLLLGALVHALWIVAIVAAAGWIGGSFTAIAAAAALPLLAAAGLLAVERESAVLDAVKAWMVLRRTTRGTRKRLRRSRSELADLLDDVYQLISASDTSAPAATRTPH
jgi:glycerol-3-phosphate O-acyltransferase / dihydroxyacetone phosphate acyltransferase